jgi:hypothetical protein
MLIFATLVRLNGNNLFIEPTLNKRLKLKENIEHNRFVSYEIKSCEFTIIIDERHIVFLIAKRIKRRPPNIRKISSKGAVE